MICGVHYERRRSRWRSPLSLDHRRIEGPAGAIAVVTDVSFRGGALQLSLRVSGLVDLAGLDAVEGDVGELLEEFRVLNRRRIFRGGLPPLLLILL